MGFKHDTAETVVEMHFPNGIRMSVEQNSAFDFAGRFLRSIHVVSDLLGKRPVDEMFINDDLHKANEQSGYDQKQRCDRHEEKQNDCRKNEGNGKKHPTEEGLGMFFKTVDRYVVATAVFFQLFRHVLASEFFPFRTGVTLGQVFANISDLFFHIFGCFVFFVDDL